MRCVVIGCDRVVGMQTGFAGLTVWSFVMAGSHGAGLMLIPALMPICSALSNATGSAAAGAVLPLRLQQLLCACIARQCF